MPIQPSYPGVYVQEIPSGVRTITGVSTSIGAFFGRTQKGPINKAVRCLSLSDFQREFGGGHPLSDTGSSIKQFFDNGGTDCYVVRIAKGAAAASVTLRNGRAVTDTASRNVLTAVAKSEGGWGQQIKLSVDYNTVNPDDSFNLTISNEADGMVLAQEIHSNLSMNPASTRFAPTLVSQSSALVNLSVHADLGDPAVNGTYFNQAASTNTPAGYSQSRRVFTASSANALRDLAKSTIEALITAGKSRFEINVNGVNASVDLAGIQARTDWITPSPNSIDGVAASLTNHIKSQIQSVNSALSVLCSWDTLATRTIVLRIASDSAPYSNVSISRGATNDISVALMLGIEQGGIEAGRYSNLRPVANGSYFWGTNAFGGFTAEIDKFAALAQNAITSITVGSRTTSVNLVTATGTSLMYEQAASGLDGVREKLRLIMQAVNADADSPCTAELWGYHLVFKRKAGTINDTAAIATATDTVFGTGFVDNVRQYSLGALGTGATQSGGTAGSDGLAAPDKAAYVGNPLTHTGFYALDTVDLFNLMIIPGDREVTEAIYAELVAEASNYCERKRAFFLADAPASWTSGTQTTADAAKVNAARIGVAKKNAAIFYPRVQFSEGGLKKYIGPSGMLAGLLARTDSQRGVWKAPAGIEADLRGVLDVELNLTDNENGVLNKLGVNCIRKFPNGIVNWGARTLDGSDDFGSEWKYIPIRRLALFLEESLFRGTKWVVFEPNDEPLWAKIRMNVNAFMLSQFRQGAFQGSTPDKAFFVKCDGETTTANDRNLGIVNIQVGFAPLKPAEFVIISIQQIPDIV